MYLKNPETQRWVEKYKTPEEVSKLADKLEKKSKTELAQKVRWIAQTVQDKSVDLRKKLQDELSETEQKEIRETLKDDDWIVETFTKWLSEDEKIQLETSKAVAWVIWEDNAKTLKKIEWIWNRLSTWFDKIWEIFNKKWIMAWIWAIILMFKWIFSWDFSALDNILNPEKENGKKNKSKEDEKINENTKYRDLTILFTKIVYSWENKNNIVNILNSSNVENLKIKEIPELLKTKNLKKKLWLDWTNYTEDEIKHALNMFHEWKWKNILDKYYKNWYQENTIREVILWIRDLNIIDEINGKISKIEISDITKIGTILWNSLSLDIKNEKWAINQKANDLWINQEIVSWFLSFNWNLNSENSKESINKNIDASNIKDKDKAKEIIQFWYSFIENLKSNKKINLWFDKILDWIKIQPKDILKLYILTWWQKEFDFDKLNDFQKSFTYISVLWILDEENDQLQAEYFTRLAWISLNKWNDFLNLVPEWVKDIIWNSINIAEDKLKKEAKELWYEIIGSIKEHPQIILWILWVIAVVWWNVRKVPFIEIPLWIWKKIVKKLK